MDLRVERTKKSIINAFLELRSRKPIEKITVKELADLAYINKATFYSHYKDIYDLSEQLEKETIETILTSITHPEEFISNPRTAIRELCLAFISSSQLISNLFSGSRSSVLDTRLEEALKKKIYETYPEYEHDREKNVIITYLIRGGFQVFLTRSPYEDPMELIEIMGNVSERLLQEP